MNKRNVRMLVIIPLLILAFLSQETQAYAWGGGGGRGGSRYGGRSWGGHGSGAGWWGLGGLFTGLALGSVIASRPVRYETVVMPDSPYYYMNGYYYQRDYYGRYVRVNPPVMVAQPQVYRQDYSGNGYYY